MRIGVICVAVVFAIVTAVAACGSSRTQDETSSGGAPSAAGKPGAFSAEARTLIAGVPADAFAIAVIDGREAVWNYILSGPIYQLTAGERKALDKELRAFVSARLGLDLSAAKTAVMFGAGAQEPTGAVLIHAIGGALKGGPVKEYQDATLMVLAPDEGLIVAKRQDVLIIGREEPVRAAVDSLTGKAPNLTGNKDLWPWIEKECGGAFVAVAGGGFDSTQAEFLRMAAAQTGIRRACGALGPTGFRAVAAGDAAKLTKTAEMLKGAMSQQLSMVEAERSRQAQEDAPTVLGASAIVGYHYLKSLTTRLEPKVSGDKIELWLPLELGDAGFLVTFIGVGAAVAIPAFMKYVKKSKTSEAREFVKKLYDGARAYYMDPNFASQSIGGSVIAPQFPTPSMGIAPPLGTCCRAGGKCAPDARLWESSTWIALQFSVDDPHYYSYEYEVVDKNSEFAVRAYGDLDCDGTYSTFEMRGLVSPGSDGPEGSAPMSRADELE